MASHDQTSSIQEIFDAALNLEDTHFKSGYDEGFSDGLLTGKDEARSVGLKSGFEIGQELGFYRGCIDIWNSAIKLDPLCFSTRVQKSIKQMNEFVSKYPFDDPENELATDVVEGLRLKFKAVCATLNVKLEYDGYPKSSNVQCIITADEVFLLNTLDLPRRLTIAGAGDVWEPGCSNLIRGRGRNQYPGNVYNNSPDNLPFEFKALEVALKAA